MRLAGLWLEPRGGREKVDSQECVVSLVSCDGRPMTSQAAISLPE